MTGSFSAQAASNNQFNLVGDTWKLVTLVTADKTVYGPSGQIFYTIRLTAEGKVELTADCNIGGGTYTLVGDKLTLSPMATTMMGCSEGSIGSQFARMLTGDHTVSWDGGNLVLTSADGTVITLKPALVDVVWLWNGPADANGTPVAIDPAKYTISFTSDGKLALGADCNRGISTYLTNDGGIAIRGIGLTRAMCAEGSLSNQFVAALETATAYRIAGGQLTLTTAAGDMVFAAQPQNTGIAATPVN